MAIIRIKRFIKLGILPHNVMRIVRQITSQDYVKAVEKFATSPNAKTILFPVEATQLIGSLGGIGALAKAALGEDGHAITPPPRRKGPFDNQDG